MSEINASQSLETTPKAVEYITTLPPIAWLCGGLLGLMAFGAIPPSVGIIMAIAGFLFIRHLDAQRALEMAKARAASYANAIGPIMVCSTSPDEGVEAIQSRAKAWRESLKLSGNHYWDKLPIIEFPYSPMLFDSSQLSAGWNIYLQLSDARRHSENMKWYEGKCPNELKALFSSAVLPVPKIEI